MQWCLETVMPIHTSHGLKYKSDALREVGRVFQLAFHYGDIWNLMNAIF